LKALAEGADLAADAMAAVGGHPLMSAGVKVGMKAMETIVEHGPEIFDRISKTLHSKELVQDQEASLQASSSFKYGPS
jgi:hypothetical protein